MHFNKPKRSNIFLSTSSGMTTLTSSTKVPTLPSPELVDELPLVQALDVSVIGLEHRTLQMCFGLSSLILGSYQGRTHADKGLSKYSGSLNDPQAAYNIRTLLPHARTGPSLHKCFLFRIHSLCGSGYDHPLYSSLYWHQ